MSNFSSYPVDWQLTTLGGLADYINSYPFKPRDWSTIGIPIVRIAQMSDPNATLDYYAGLLPPEFCIDNGDLLFSWSATLLALIWNRGPACLNQHIYKVIPKNGNDLRFLCHLLNRLIEPLANQSHGTTMKHVTRGDLLPFPVTVPLPPEQSRIAAVLDTVDAASAQTEAIIAKLKQVRAGLLHNLLTRGLDEHGQLRPPPAEAPHLYQDSALGKIPREWEIGPFRAFGSANRPYLKTGPFGSSLKQEHWVSEGIPVVTIGSLGEGEFIHSELLHVSAETAYLLSAYSLAPGDIVFSRVADVGRSVAVKEAERGWIMSSNMMWVSLDQQRTEPDYIQANFAANSIVRSQIKKLVNAAGRDVANAPIMNSLLFPWAPVDEQKRITTVLQNINDYLNTEKVELHKMQLLKQGLMSDLLIGRVRVPESLSSTEINDKSQ